MYLEKGDLIMRSATLSDTKILANWWNDGKVMAHAGFPNGIGISEETILKNLKPEQNPLFILEINGKPVGEMSYRDIEENVAEIGIKICDFSVQTKGYGTQFLKMLISYLFEQRGYERIILDTNLKNKRAQHVYEKIGFRKIRVNIDSWENQLGEVQSSVDYEITKEEFNSR
ncbi:GNAT family N-acetyltransferase [Alkaliphilus serpentinus]|uniref:GNAT family N-acetyltransferase n=1 Tax=Alkaliphilus serpentinus TaxID=1482731 RepID=A0A833HNE7_9FIRM|nr:GNAT family protein [Alkaliphilus serpentinus]KAB3529398.1 GNAT family N-acetyltransferase [Alkaliphilus serpentinus]